MYLKIYYFQQSIVEIYNQFKYTHLYNIAFNIETTEFYSEPAIHLHTEKIIHYLYYR